MISLEQFVDRCHDMGLTADAAAWLTSPLLNWGRTEDMYQRRMGGGTDSRLGGADGTGAGEYGYGDGVYSGGGGGGGGYTEGSGTGSFVGGGHACLVSREVLLSRARA